MELRFDMGEPRVNKTTKNIKYLFLGQAITYLVTFAGRSVFIRCLDKEYLGVGGLFSNILSFLALAELGIGIAMNYFLYKPLAQNDEKTTAAYMNFYATAYRIIGLLVIFIGTLLTPLLPFIIKEQTGISNLWLIYLLYVLDSGATYFFSYKRAIFIADQNGYVDTLNHLYLSVCKTALQCLVLVFTHNFILYLCVQIILTLLFNIIISIKADRAYPYLKQYRKERISKTQRGELSRYIRAMMSHKAGSVLITGTDNILITMLDSIIVTGLYSNYYLITASLTKMSSQAYSAFTASVGNLNVLGEAEHKRTVFSRCFFLNNWITCFCSVCLWCLFQPFVTLWAGPDYLLSWSVIFVIVLDFYLRSMNQPAHSFKTAGGLFWNDRFRPIIEAAINLFISIALGRTMGILGVLWGTAISMIVTRCWVEPYVVFKYTLKQKGTWYCAEYAKFTALTVALALFTNALVKLLPYGSIMAFIVQCMICVVVPNAIMVFLFHRKPEFRYALDLVRKKLRR